MNNGIDIGAIRINAILNSKESFKKIASISFLVSFRGVFFQKENKQVSKISKMCINKIV